MNTSGERHHLRIIELKHPINGEKYEMLSCIYALFLSKSLISFAAVSSFRELQKETLEPPKFLRSIL